MCVRTSKTQTFVREPGRTELSPVGTAESEPRRKFWVGKRERAVP